VSTPAAAVFAELVRLETEVWNAVDARLRATHDLPFTRYEPLRVIHARPGCRVQDVATELVITVGGASKLVDRLADAGFCRRLPHPADGRSSALEITDAGSRLLHAAARTVDEELHTRLGAVLGRDDLDHLASLVQRLRARHRQIGDRS
jgi:DNA-binding MarR family transcriptional regulator